MGKTFKHFQDQAVVGALMDEMRDRHGRSYEAVIDGMVADLGAWFEAEFGASQSPTRFRGVASGLVRERYLVALSGGIDSTVVTYLATRAVGVDRVLPITMPAHPEDDSPRFAALVREHLGFREPGAPYVIDIAGVVREHARLMTGLGDGQLDLAGGYEAQSREQRMRSGNLGSRVRVAVMYDLQRAIRGRVLGTSNRTEYCQGYSTKFGTPISYDLGVLDDLYKVDVYEVGRRLGVPAEILAAAPSTGYFPGQTHEGELGATLEEQDVFAYLLFERSLSPEQVAHRYGASLAFARVMQRRWDVSLHKRKLIAGQDRLRVARQHLPV
jgi:NAD+ synthase